MLPHKTPRIQGFEGVYDSHDCQSGLEEIMSKTKGRSDDLSGVKQRRGAVIGKPSQVYQKRYEGDRLVRIEGHTVGRELRCLDLATTFRV